MQKLQMFFIGAITFSQVVLPGTISITGQGESSNAPENFNIQVTINSICYSSTLEAKNANAELANKIAIFSEKFLRNSKDKITTTPGGFMRETEYIPAENGRTKILCERKWKTWNSVQLTLHDISTLPEFQDELFNLLAPLENLNPAIQAQTFVHISSPHFDVTSETQKKLRKEAQEGALKDAKDQLANFDANCHFTGSKLTSVSTPNFSSVVRYGVKSESDSNYSTPVIPEKITVTAIWNFVWEFISASGCYQ